jgi:ssDNA-binding Zn-finger/Zn-ribbon topoisomerase 1
MTIRKTSVWVMECKRCGHTCAVADKKLKQHYSRFTCDECPKCHATSFEHVSTVKGMKMIA